MKNMTDRKMDMGMAGVDSDDYFPSEAKHHKMDRAGEIKGFNYPDTEEMVHADTNQAVKATSANMPKTGFRH